MTEKPLHAKVSKLLSGSVCISDTLATHGYTESSLKGFSSEVNSRMSVKSRVNVIGGNVLSSVKGQCQLSIFCLCATPADRYQRSDEDP